MNLPKRLMGALTVLTISATFATGCKITPEPSPGQPGDAGLKTQAESDRQWTGLALTFDYKLFVNYPNWSEGDYGRAVAEYWKGKGTYPFPNEDWQNYTPGGDVKNKFVAVQALWRDEAGKIWILDPGNPRFEGVVTGAPKILRVDPYTHNVEYVFHFGDDVIMKDSYLNDVRVDLDNGFAYITDSGDGALIALNLNTNKALRFLDNHVSTEAEDIDVTINGEIWRPNGDTRPKVHTDGIALSPDGKFVYYQSLTGKTLYRVPSQVLRADSVIETITESAVEKVLVHEPVDGIMFGPDGYLYLTTLESNAIKRMAPDGTVQVVIQDDRISWPDSFAFDTKGRIWFTTSRIHEGASPTAPYKVYTIVPAAEDDNATAE